MLTEPHQHRHATSQHGSASRLIHKVGGVLLLAILIINNACGPKKRPPMGKRDTFRTQSGKKIVINAIKHSSIQINIDGKEIEIDPVGSAVRPIIVYSDKPEADYILVTHEHYDHMDWNAINLLTYRGTNLIVSPSVFRRLGAGIMMKNNDHADLGKGLKLYAVPAYNITPGRLRHHPKGDGNGYILEYDGFRIYIAGDTEFIPEMKKITDIDVAFLPCDSPKTMTTRQLREAAETIHPRVLYPYHLNLTPPDSVMKALEGLKGTEIRMYYLK